MNRREFLEGSTLAAGGLLLGSGGIDADAAPAAPAAVLAIPKSMVGI